MSGACCLESLLRLHRRGLQGLRRHLPLEMGRGVSRVTVEGQQGQAAW